MNHKKNTLYLTNILLLTLGLFWAFIHIFLRLIMERPSYNLVDLKPIITEKLMFIFLSFILLHFILILSYFYKIYCQYYPRKNLGLIQRLLKPVSKIIDCTYNKPIEYVQNLTFPHIPGSARFFFFITETSWRYRDFSYFNTLVFSFEYLPKIIVGAVFCIELTALGQIKFFLHILPLLIIPICFSIFLSAYTSFSERCIKDIYKYVEHAEIIPHVEEDGIWRNEFICRIRLKPEYQGRVDVQEISDGYITLDRIRDLSNVIKEASSKMSPYLLIIVSSLYILGGIYRVFVIWS